MRSLRPSLFLAAMTLLAVPASAHAGGCNLPAKLKAVGKKEFGLLRCQSRVAATGDSSGLGACEAKVSGKFRAAFGTTGLCGAPGNPTPCEDIIDCCENVGDRCDSSVAGAFVEVFPSRCEAAKRKAAGRLANRELRCYARAAARGLAVDSRCIGRATASFTAAVARAGTCPDGGSPRSFVEDNCVKPAVATDGSGIVTEACPSTTTTTTMTTTTTTAVPHQACGIYPTCGGACPAGQTCVSIPPVSECLCYDAGGCVASWPACNGACSSGGSCSDLGAGVCGCVHGGCSCGGTCTDAGYDCLDTGSRLGCGCFSFQ